MPARRGSPGGTGTNWDAWIGFVLCAPVRRPIMTTRQSGPRYPDRAGQGSRPDPSPGVPGFRAMAAQGD